MTEKYYYEKEWSKHMWKAENWKDYEVLDTGNGEKLERWGDYPVSYTHLTLPTTERV